MKFEIDTENKTITILEDVNTDEVIALLKLYEKGGYTLKVKNVINYIPQFPILNPDPLPWDPFKPWKQPTITYGTSH